LYAAVKHKPDLLKRVADELDALQGVLAELRCRGLPAKLGPPEERDAPAAVFGSCEATLRGIKGHLASLQAIFARGGLSRLLAHRRFKEEMEEVGELRKHLESFKITLGIALQLRTM